MSDSETVPWWLRDNPVMEQQFTEDFGPPWKINSPAPILTDWWHEERIMRDAFREQYRPQHPARLSQSRVFTQDHDHFAAKLASSHAIYIGRLTIHDNAQAEVTAMSELTTTDILSAWLYRPAYMLLNLGVEPFGDPFQAPAVSNGYPATQDATQDLTWGWGSADESATAPHDGMDLSSIPGAVEGAHVHCRVGSATWAVPFVCPVPLPANVRQRLWVMRVGRPIGSRVVCVE
ncbi:hypothetical protein C8R46DRAFT_1035135 [Mycena filopes]|nr:hypothetical protein C8R46DRAFT_1035135 [Mycena filopes]